MSALKWDNRFGACAIALRACVRARDGVRNNAVGCSSLFSVAQCKPTVFLFFCSETKNAAISIAYDFEGLDDNLIFTCSFCFSFHCISPFAVCDVPHMKNKDIEKRLRAAPNKRNISLAAFSSFQYFRCHFSPPYRFFSSSISAYFAVGIRVSFKVVFSFSFLPFPSDFAGKLTPIRNWETLFAKYNYFYRISPKRKRACRHLRYFLSSREKKRLSSLFADVTRLFSFFHLHYS